MANSKQKGSKNERELCKWFTDWTGLEFSRVPASGGLRWKKTDNISGDIICSDERGSKRFPFSVETKFYKDINFEHIILGNKKVKVLEFWEQAKEDGIRAKKEPLLFMRYNGMPKKVWFLVMKLSTFEIMRKMGHKIEGNYFIISTPTEDLLCMNTNDILSLSYERFRRRIKTKLKNNNGN